MKKLSIVLIFLIGLVALVSGQTLEASETKALVHIEVTDFEGNPLQGETLLFRSEKSGKAVKRVSGEDGKSTILLPKGDTYKIAYMDLTNEEEYNSLDIPDKPGLMEATLTLQIETGEKEVYALDIHFVTASAKILENSYSALNGLAEQLKQKPTLRIEIGGHTDSDGSDAANLKLSQSRAASVRTYLISKRIDGNRMESKGYGESVPVASNDSDDGKAQNRRTEIRILSE